MRGSLPGNGDLRTRKRLRRGPRQALAVALAAGIILGLAACGNLSLIGSLHREAPGGLRFSPADPVIALGANLTISVMGGITPYSIMSGMVTPVNDHTWEFPATSTGSFPIQVSDGTGKKVETLVTVYAGGEPALNVSEVTLPEGSGWTFTVAGGAPPYGWELDGVLQPSGAAPNASYDFLPTPQGTFVVEVLDSAGVSQAAIVTVVPNGVGVDPLSITPLSAVVLPGGKVAVTALGGDGNYVFSAPDGGSIDNANPATYVAPGIGTYGIDVADGSGPSAVSATVIVTATGALLVLSPGGVTVSAVHDEVQFSASGGSPSYTFSTNKPALGFVDPVTGLYRQLAAGNVVVTVVDAFGLKDNTVVKWNP
jgi:hypothetical protein